MATPTPEPTDAPPDRTRKSPNRGAPKYAFGDRGFNAGSYPKVGPFEILRQRPLRKGAKEEEFREGRGFYNLGDYPHKSPPPEGWAEYLAGRFGSGTYKIHHKNPHDKAMNRSLFYIDREAVQRLDMRRAENPPRDDVQDEPEPERTRPNPPDPIANFVEQLQQLRQAEELLRPEPAPAPVPAPPPGFAELIARSLMSNPQVMAQIAQVVMPRPNPPAPPPPSDPQGAVIARFVREQGITPEEAIDALTMFAIAKKERDSQQAGPDHSRGDNGPNYPFDPAP